MTIILIAVAVIMLAMNAAIFYVLYSAAGMTKKQVASCFVRELEDYSDYLSERKEECDQIENRKEEIAQEISEMEGIMVSLRSSPYYAPKKIATDLYVPTARYVDNKFFDAHRIVNEKMDNIDYDSLIRRIKEKHPYHGDKRRYDNATSILKMLDTDALYSISCLDGNDQADVLAEALDEKQRGLLDEFILSMEDGATFDALNFRTFLREIKTENDPVLYVRVGTEKMMKRSTDLIVYQLDLNISEGIKVYFQNKNFDFSIYRLREK